MNWKGRLIWECKIGINEIGELESGSDSPMRDIIRVGFIVVTGREPDFIFSGWNSSLTPIQEEVIEEYKK